jgi:uncharacterized protein (DUF433 family)
MFAIGIHALRARQIACNLQESHGRRGRRPAPWVAGPGLGEVRLNVSDRGAQSKGTLMSKLEQRNIEKVADRCGGRAVVAGTRIRVSLILNCYRRGMTVEEIVELYSHLRPADVHDALAYAYDHPQEIEVDLAADDEETVQQRWPGGRAT